MPQCIIIPFERHLPMDSIPMQSPVRTKVKVTAIPGDGIGPEVMKATQTVLAAAGAQVEWEEALAGAEAFKRGVSSGAPQETPDSIAPNGVALKGPLETPVGYGEKSANVALRKTFEMYGNVRPVRELPGIRTPFSGGASISSSSARTSRTSMRASSTCRRRASRSA